MLSVEKFKGIRCAGMIIEGVEKLFNTKLDKTTKTSGEGAVKGQVSIFDIHTPLECLGPKGLFF
jgi:hypothetical protein